MFIVSFEEKTMAQENIENTGQGGQPETGAGGAGKVGEKPAPAVADETEKVKNNDGGKNNAPAKQTNYSSSNGGVVALGVYLVVLTLLFFYGFKVLMTAETPQTRVADNGKKQISCGTDTRELEEATSDDTSDQKAKTNSAETNAANADPTNTDTNATNTNNVNASTNTTTNVANKTTGGNSKANAKQGGNGNNENTKTKTTAQTVKSDVPEVTVPPYLCVKAAFSYNRILPADGYLFLVVLFAGILGALLRGIGSFVRHLGLGDFSFQWAWFYLLLPLSGAIVSLAIYLVLRGGFYGGGVGKGLVLNVFAFAALAVLTGLFSENAIEKLRQVAVTLLTDVPAKVEKK